VAVAAESNTKPVGAMKLRHFSEEHIREDCTTMTGEHEDGLFFGCRFDRLNGLTLKDCDLNRSEFQTEKVRDALGFTLTLSCLSFRNVKFSALLFDLMLCLLSMSAGNDEKRAKLRDVVGAGRFDTLMRVLKGIE